MPSVPLVRCSQKLTVDAGHWLAGWNTADIVMGVAPLTPTAKVALLLAITVSADGWAVMDGDVYTKSTAFALWTFMAEASVTSTLEVLVAAGSRDTGDGRQRGSLRPGDVAAIAPVGDTVLAPLIRDGGRARRFPNRERRSCALPLHDVGGNRLRCNVMIGSMTVERGWALLVEPLVSVTIT